MKRALIYIGTFALAFLIGTLVVGCPSQEEIRARQRATQTEAEQFATGFDGVKKVACSESDSDLNGYVTCTVFLRDNEVRELECNPQGCKIKEEKQNIKVKKDTTKINL